MFLASKYEDIWAIKFDELVNEIGHNAYNKYFL